MLTVFLIAPPGDYLVFAVAFFRETTRPPLTELDNNLSDLVNSLRNHPHNSSGSLEQFLNNTPASWNFARSLVSESMREQKFLDTILEINWI